MRIPKLRAGSFFPALLERRRRVDQALTAQEFPYVLLDATYCKARVGHRIVSQAIGTVFQGAGWQRCRVHFMRNVLAVVPKGSQEMVASIIRTIFAQPDREHIEKQFAEVSTMLGRSHPKVAAMLINAQPDLLAFAAFPRRHWRQIWFTNP